MQNEGGKAHSHLPIYLVDTKYSTSFDPEPKIGQKRVDLLRLYHRVLADGGYDRVSNTREMPLAWKAVGGDLGLDKATHAGALAFSLKTAYYRNLAYELQESLYCAKQSNDHAEPTKLPLSTTRSLHQKKSSKTFQPKVVISSRGLSKIIQYLVGLVRRKTLKVHQIETRWTSTTLAVEEQ